jgi:cell division protein FtsW
MAASAKTAPRTEPVVGRIDWPLLVAVLLLIVIGLMMVFSATFGFKAEGHEDDPYYFFKRQLGWLAVGLVCMTVAARMRYPLWKRLSIPILLLTLGLLAFVAFSGDTVMGARRAVFGTWAQPSELAKLSVIVYIGHWLASKGLEKLRQLPYGLLPFTIMVGVIAALIVMQPDISSAILITAVAVAMFFLAGADWIQFAIGLVAGGTVFGVAIHNSPHASERIRDFWQAWKDPLTGGAYQSKQALYALGSGGVFGVGPGNGRMKFGWLPAAHNDGIFAILGEELGLVGCLAVVGLFAFLAYRGFRIAAQTRNSFGTLLATGITCWIAFQAIIHIGVNVGVVPVTGMPLPFISAGGSSLVFCLVGVGVLLSISRGIGADVDQLAGKADGESSESADSGRRDRRSRVSGSRRAATMAERNE